jgi:hypothetical protein
MYQAASPPDDTQVGEADGNPVNPAILSKKNIYASSGVPSSANPKPSAAAVSYDLRPSYIPVVFVNEAAGSAIPV